MKHAVHRPRRQFKKTDRHVPSSSLGRSGAGVLFCMLAPIASDRRTDKPTSVHPTLPSLRWIERSRPARGRAMHRPRRVAVRQWVLSLPRWARFLLARDPQLITRTLDVALRAIFAHQRLRARRAGALAPRVGAVTFVQRFGGALNLNVHFHSVIPDGVFVQEV